MTNREKTRELARKHQGTMTDAQYLSMFNAIEEMAEWKDKEFEKQLKIQKFKVKLMDSVIVTQGTMIGELLNEKKENFITMQ